MFILEFIAGVLIIGFLVVGIVIALIIKVLGGTTRPPRQAAREDDMEEARMIQEMYRGMSRLEQRVDALETLLLDHASPRPPEPPGKDEES